MHVSDQKTIKTLNSIRHTEREEKKREKERERERPTEKIKVIHRFRCLNSPENVFLGNPFVPTVHRQIKATQKHKTIFVRRKLVFFCCCSLLSSDSLTHSISGTRLSIFPT